MNTCGAHSDAIEFEALYLRLRQVEGRLYTDEELSQLPNTPKQSRHYREWLTRQRSAKKLVRYIERKIQNPTILEVGCGNGWLSHMLSKIAGSKVIGIDVNFTELQQAARVFQYASNLHFVYTDIRSGLLAEKKIDVVVFAASLQYFEDAGGVIADAKRLLTPSGELHIIDSPFYEVRDIAAARQRSRAYYEQAGFPAMADCYFHHSLAAFDQYNYQLLFDPRRWVHRVRRPGNPLYWVRIKND